MEKLVVYRMCPETAELRWTKELLTNPPLPPRTAGFSAAYTKINFCSFVFFMDVMKQFLYR